MALSEIIVYINHRSASNMYEIGKQHNFKPCTFLEFLKLNIHFVIICIIQFFTTVGKTSYRRQFLLVPHFYGKEIDVVY